MAEENLNAAIAHAILSFVVSPCIGNSALRGYISPGVHANLFSHGILGFLNFQGTKFGDFNKIYKISLVASKVLPLAFINAYLKRSNDALSAVHLLSGLIPLGLTLSGTEDLKLVHLSDEEMAPERGDSNKGGTDENAVNASIAHVVLCCVSGQGMCTSQGLNFSQVGMHGNLFAFGMLGYIHHQSARFNVNISPLYEISARASRFLAIPCMMADLHKGNHMVNGLHLLSGLVPFTFAMVSGGKPDDYALGNLVVACNIISLGHWSLENHSEWGCYTVGAAIFTYFFAPKMGPRIIYPFGLALLEYCAYRTFRIKLARKKIILNFIIAVMLIVNPCGA